MDPYSLKRRRDETDEEHDHRAPPRYTSHHSHPRTVEESGSLLLGRMAKGTNPEVDTPKAQMTAQRSFGGGTNPEVDTPKVQMTAQRSFGGGMTGDSQADPLHHLCANMVVRIGRVLSTQPGSRARWQHPDRRCMYLTVLHPDRIAVAHAAPIYTSNGSTNSSSLAAPGIRADWGEYWIRHRTQTLNTAHTLLIKHPHFTPCSNTYRGFKGDSLTAPLHLSCANKKVRIGKVLCTNPPTRARWQHLNQQDALSTEWHPGLAHTVHTCSLDTHAEGTDKYPHPDPRTQYLLGRELDSVSHHTTYCPRGPRTGKAKGLTPCASLGWTLQRTPKPRSHIPPPNSEKTHSKAKDKERGKTSKRKGRTNTPDPHLLNYKQIN